MYPVTKRTMNLCLHTVGLEGLPSPCPPPPSIHQYHVLPLPHTHFRVRQWWKLTRALTTLLQWLSVINGFVIGNGIAHIQLQDTLQENTYSNLYSAQVRHGWAGIADTGAVTGYRWWSGTFVTTGSSGVVTTGWIDSWVSDSDIHPNTYQIFIHLIVSLLVQTGLQHMQHNNLCRYVHYDHTACTALY